VIGVVSFGNSTVAPGEALRVGEVKHRKEVNLWSGDCSSSSKTVFSVRRQHRSRTGQQVDSCNKGKVSFRTLSTGEQFEAQTIAQAKKI
jgi:hypothetical protein